jgi:hypothetical protein
MAGRFFTKTVGEMQWEKNLRRNWKYTAKAFTLNVRNYWALMLPLSKNAVLVFLYRSRPKFGLWRYAYIKQYIGFFVELT